MVITKPLPTHRTTQTQNKHAHRHRTQDPTVRAGEDSSLDRTATVID
jgi:hypothetical protein